MRAFAACAFEIAIIGLIASQAVVSSSSGRAAPVGAPAHCPTCFSHLLKMRKPPHYAPCFGWTMEFARAARRPRSGREPRRAKRTPDRSFGGHSLAEGAGAPVRLNGGVWVVRRNSRGLRAFFRVAPARIGRRSPAP